MIDESSRTFDIGWYHNSSLALVALDFSEREGGGLGEKGKVPLVTRTSIACLSRCTLR